MAAARYDTVTGNSRMQRLGDGVKVTLRQHRKQPCHAAFITSRGEVAYVCTDRGRHAGEAGSGVLDLKAVEREKGFGTTIKRLRKTCGWRTCRSLASPRRRPTNPIPA